MRKLQWFLVVFLIGFFLSGCASLGELAQDIQDLDASTEIAAVTSISQDIVSQPWDNFLQIGLGYGLALLRRWYKKKKGAK